VARCRVCGREFDPRRFQVVVPALGQGFDRVECAEQALSVLGPAAVPVPLAPVERPVPAVPSAAGASPVATGAEGRRLLLLGANLALLAAGTAATVFLWFRVFGADPTPLDLDLAGPAASAFERVTVPAQIAGQRSAPQRKPAPAAPVASSLPPAPAVPAAPATDGAGMLVAAPTSTRSSRTLSAANGNAIGGDAGTAPEPRTELNATSTLSHGKSADAPYGKASGHRKNDHGHGFGRQHGDRGGGHGKPAGKGYGKHD
jgi:hypothetical protein